MSQISLEEIIQNTYNAMTEQLRGKNKEHNPPPLALIFKDDKIGIIPVSQLAFAGHAWKEVLAQIIKSINEQISMDAYVVGQNCSALVDPSIDDFLKIIHGEQVSNNEEILIIQAGDTFQTIEKIWTIARDPENGKIVDFITKETTDMAILGGFFDLLVKRPERLN